MKNQGISFALACVLTLTAGCGKGAASPTAAAESSAPAAESVTASEMKTITDAADRTVEIPADVEKVIVTFNLEEYIAAAGEGWDQKLAGWSHAYWEGRRQDAWDAYTTAFPDLVDIPDIGYNDGLNIETIISLDPDVIIASSAVNKDFFDAQEARLEEAGIPVVYVNYHKQTLEMHRKSTEVLGQVLGQEARAAEIADFYEEQMNVITETLKDLKDEDRPDVYMEFSRGPEEFGNTWSTKMWGALIQNCGGNNIAKDLGDGNSVDMAPEMILAADPDVIIFTASPQTDISDNVVLGYGADEATAMANLEAYKDREGWADISAVKNNRMGALYHDLSRHIFDFVGAQFLAEMIHPELFEDMDPVENLKTFYERFMPVELDGAWMIRLQ